MRHCREKSIARKMLAMARTTIKATYALDVDTVRALESMAERSKVSKSEALRRAIRTASTRVGPGGTDALKALDELQRSLKLTPEGTRAWAERTRAERRRATSKRPHRRG